MAEVALTVAGRPYRLACDDGEEEQLKALAAAFDERVSKLRAALGEPGETRLLVMAGLTVMDELADARTRIAELERALAGSTDEFVVAAKRAEAAQESAASAIVDLATRLEALAREIAEETRRG